MKCNIYTPKTPKKPTTHYDLIRALEILGLEERRLRHLKSIHAHTFSIFFCADREITYLFALPDNISIAFYPPFSHSANIPVKYLPSTSTCSSSAFTDPDSFQQICIFCSVYSLCNIYLRAFIPIFISHLLFRFQKPLLVVCTFIFYYYSYAPPPPPSGQ